MVLVKLPLRLKLAFKNWTEIDRNFRLCFEAICHIKLFTLEVILDKSALPFFFGLKDSLPFSGHNKILKIPRGGTISECGLQGADFRMFNEVEIEIPFNLTDTGLNEELNKIDAIKHFPNPGISFYLTRHNIEQFGRIIDFASSTGIKKIRVPNPDLINHLGKIKDAHLRADDLKGLETLKNSINSLHELDLQVHDYFLAKYLGLKDAEQFAGCQAGQLLGYIQNGIVYPCESIPVSLGSLFEEDFDTIWKRSNTAMDKIINALDCLKCSRSGECKNGCPGTAYFLNSGLKDPLCND